jgi:hypothetical protein
MLDRLNYDRRLFLLLLLHWRGLTLRLLRLLEKHGIFILLFFLVAAAAVVVAIT